MEGSLSLARALLALSDQDCAEILRAARYGGSHPASCSTCGGHRFHRIRNKPRVDRCRTCRAEHSVTAGTPLHGLKMPLGRILAALVLLTRPGSISTRRLARMFDIHWKDAAALAHKLRLGLAADRPALAPTSSRLEVANFFLRWDPGTRPADPWLARWTRAHLTATALVDVDSGHYLAELTHKDRPLVTKHLVEEHLPGVDPVPSTEGGSPRLGYVGGVLRSTHRLVSGRWLRVYVRGLGWSAGPGDAPTSFLALRAVLRGPPRTWAQVRPPRPQRRER